MTKGEIDRLGIRIGNSVGAITTDDLDALQEYRKTFQEPLAAIFTYVTKEARRLDKGCIVTYRIKRIDTIIEKLRRFSINENGEMKLSRMWDIAGCRCIFCTNDEEKLYLMVERIKEAYGDCKVNDYVRAGAKSSGYRSIHIYVKDKTTGKPVEIQIRNYLHHNWATLVEILDVLYGKSIKEGKEQGKLERFLYLYSKATKLSGEEFMELISIENKYRIFEKMSSTLTRNYLNIKRQWLQQPERGSFFVITANKDGSSIQSYYSFDDAEDEYYKKYVSCRDSNIVLTHIPYASFDQISMAYSNYVLAMHAFFDDYRSLVADNIIKTIENNLYLRFFRLFKIYKRNLKCHIGNLKIELTNIAVSGREKNIKRNQLNKWARDINQRILNWQKETTAFLRRLSIATSSKSIYKFLVKRQVKKMAKVVRSN